MKYLLDTDALSEPVRRQPSAAFMDRFARAGHEVCTSVLCVGEMIYGARRQPRRIYEEYLRDVVLGRMWILDVDVRAATAYGELRVLAERAGGPRGDFDLLIAATATVHDLVVVTRNRRHFDDLPGVRVEDWTAS